MHTYTHTRVRELYVHMYNVCTYTCTVYTRMHIHLYCMYTCMHIHLYCMYTCTMYVYVHTCLLYVHIKVTQVLIGVLMR